MLATLAACHDYALKAEIPDTGGAPDTEQTWGAEDTASFDEPSTAEGQAIVDPWKDLVVDAAFDVSYAWSGFGTSDAGGRVEVAFFRPEEGDGTGGGGGQSITFPDEPGACAYTAFDLSEEQSNGAISLRGTYEAGDALTASDGGGALALERHASDDGTVRYQLADRSHDAYPFGRVLDLEAPGDPEGVPGFVLEGVFAVGPDVRLTLPPPEALDAGVLPHSRSEELELAWSYVQDVPEPDSGPLAVQRVFLLRTQRRSDNRTTEALACLPDQDNYYVVPAEDLVQMAVDPGDGSTYTMAQLDLYWEGADVQTPWGQFVRIRSWMAVSGEVRLTP